MSDVIYGRRILTKNTISGFYDVIKDLLRVDGEWYVEPSIYSRIELVKDGLIVPETQLQFVAMPTASATRIFFLACSGSRVISPGSESDPDDK